MSAPAEPRPVWYTFGNHFHWVDMQWKWGYGVLADSVADMLAFCAATGARGNINFDAVGYEKMAAESPAALARLRDAIADGQIEVVGASYAQPYGLFHGGESAVRQLSYGTRVAARLLGTTPRSFWEEECFFFPQLPQLLAGTGFRYASLFFQWTWHTPYVPMETAPAIWWEGLDGTRILTAPRSSLSLHQWPEDFAALRADPLLADSPAPVITQWLELLPSEDWMCRSELLVPGVAQLAGTPGIELRFGTLSEVLDSVRQHAVTRHYTMDDVFHGMSLGKNGSLLHRRSRAAEETLLAAEALSVLAGRLGRPYPNWDVYPVWELEEAWRDLLTAQHHDNDECEGLCGSIGYASLDRALSLAGSVLRRTVEALATRLSPRASASPLPGAVLAVNQLGWERPTAVATPSGPALLDLPPAGWRIREPGTDRLLPPIAVTATPHTLTLRRGSLRLDVAVSTGLATRLVVDGTEIVFPSGLGALTMTRDGRPEIFADVRSEVSDDGQAIVVRRASADGHEVTLTFSCAPERDAIDLTIASDALPIPDPWYAAGLTMAIEPKLDSLAVWHDTPYAITPVDAGHTYPRKYPTGDWMTSRQVFEDIPGPFSALQLVDLRGADGRGLLWLHDGAQGYQRLEDGIQVVLSVNDAWDEGYFLSALSARFRLLPHSHHLRPSQMWRLAKEFTSPALTVPLPTGQPVAGRTDPPLPRAWSLLEVNARSVAITAQYRETAFSAAASDEHVTQHAPCPVMVRLVEFDGTATDVELSVGGTVQRAWQTDLLGGIIGELAVRTSGGSLQEPSGGQRSQILLRMRGYEIATVALDITQARKSARDLDASRSVWATVHRTGIDQEE